MFHLRAVKKLKIAIFIYLFFLTGKFFYPLQKGGEHLTQIDQFKCLRVIVHKSGKDSVWNQQASQCHSIDLFGRKELTK